MAQLTYAEYQAKQAAARPAGNGNANGPKAHYMGEFLKNDGDVAVVRFPYQSMNELSFTTTHNVPMPGAPFGKRIRCTGDDNCEFCAQGIKVDTRFFAKMIVYTVNEQSGEVELNPTVWDRPAAFADIDLKSLFEEYGDISEQLFKIKRNGTGTQTRYTISIIMNKTVYNPSVYKADFSQLDQVDPVKVLSKSVAQYREAMGVGEAKEEVKSVVRQEVKAAPVVEETYEAPVTRPVVEEAKPVEAPKRPRYTF